MKRVIIIHGWSGAPNQHWIPWLKEQLESHDIEVFAPQMPNTDEPEIKAWVEHLSKIVGKLDKDTYFVGHSIGCQAILRYLEKINTQVGGALFIGGWFTLKGLDTPEEKTISTPWLETPINYEKVKKACNKIIAYFSDDDPYVPLENIELFKKNLNAETHTDHKKEHYTEEAGITELPHIRDRILKLIESGE